MPQTLLALFALMLSSTFALQQSRHTLQTEMNMIVRESRTHAQGIASEVFAEIAALEYDEATSAAGGFVPADELTPAPFEQDLLFGDAQYIDDVHGMVPYLKTRTLIRPDGSQAVLTFAVTATVEYAEIRVESGDEVMAPTTDGSQTFTKLVTLRVRCLDLDATGWGNTTLLTIARPFSFTDSRF